MNRCVVRVRDVGWRAGSVQVLERVTFDLAAGELVAVMGRNGAGKSTLLDIVAGVRAPSEGTVFLTDRPVGSLPPRERARLLAHLPQSVRGDLSISAEALVLMGRYAHAGGWFESAEDREAARLAMAQCECLAFGPRPLTTLSGGERQRVFLAACLAQQAQVLLLDEPATFLDVDQQLQCFRALRAEADRGTACLAVTHDVNLALTFCTRLIVLADGAVAYDFPVTGALDATGWLRALSHKLEVLGAAGARRWVGYQ